MIGLYGGSFDPVHLGHLRIAEDIREYYYLEKIIFIPAYHSPLKPKSRASAEDRLNMLKISIKYNPYFDVDDFELKKGGKSYTVDTFRYFREERGIFPLFILGADAFLSLHKWKRPEELISMGSFIVIGRNTATAEKITDYIKQYFPQLHFYTNKKPEEIEGRVYFFDSRRIDISSTEIRNRVKQKMSIKYLVLPEVEDYIFSKKLYRGEENGYRV